MKEGNPWQFWKGNDMAKVSALSRSLEIDFVRCYEVFDPRLRSIIGARCDKFKCSTATRDLPWDINLTALKGSLDRNEGCFWIRTRSRIHGKSIGLLHSQQVKLIHELFKIDTLSTEKGKKEFEFLPYFHCHRQRRRGGGIMQKHESQRELKLISSVRCRLALLSSHAETVRKLLAASQKPEWNSIFLKSMLINTQPPTSTISSSLDTHF